MADEPRRRARLRIEAVAVVAVVVAGCGTTTVGGQNAARWLAEHNDHVAEVVTDGPEGRFELRRVRIVASSPTEIQLRSADGEVVPIESARQIRVSEPGLAIVQGAGIGLALGLGFLAAVVLRGDNPSPDCDICWSRNEALAIFGPMFGGGGIVLGALIGLAVGHTDVLTF